MKKENYRAEMIPDAAARNAIEDARTPAPDSVGQVGKRPVLLTIAGFDPSSGAGISADLKVFAAHGFYGMACITALTVQSTLGVKAVEAVGAATVAATLETLARDVTFSGIKLGMLANREIVEIVNIFLRAHAAVPVVLDPVIRSSSGRKLLDADGVQVLRQQLLGRVDWITPNLDELSALTQTPVTAAIDVPAAAEELRRLGREAGNPKLNIVVTGGHLDPPDDYLAAASGECTWNPGERIETTATHGTGCSYSSALLCRIVEGEPPTGAATKAKDYVTGALRAAYPVGRGRGPMNHFYRYSPHSSKNEA